jgi:cytochrome P450
VVANPELLADAIEESLRFNTSAQRFRRRLMKDVTLHGQTMKEGDFVCLAYGSGNRDERQYPNPDVYDITRKPRGHLGFGGGVHACLGTAIARLSVKIAFDEFHKVVPELHTCGRPTAMDAFVHLPQPAGAGSGSTVLVTTKAMARGAVDHQYRDLTFMGHHLRRRPWHIHDP